MQKLELKTLRIKFKIKLKTSEIQVKAGHVTRTTEFLSC